MAFAEGFYDLVVTETGALNLATVPRDLVPLTEQIDAGELAGRISDALHRVLSKLLEEVEGDDSERTLAQVAVVNTILADLRKRFHGTDIDVSDFQIPPTALKGVFRGGHMRSTPETGLVVPWLFTAGKGSPSLLSELRKEIASCDAVDILVSFITLSGVRKLEDLLKSVTAVGADGRPRTKIRVLTTTYTGATDVGALDILASLPGCEVRISLDGRRTRLHAKAWMFHRRTSFGSAYVGSANLSGAALLGGLEWTVKFTQQGQENLYTRSVAHFETLWNDGEFQHYDPNDNEHRVQLIRALKRESGDGLIASPTFFDIEPKDYQREMLESIGAERSHGRMKSLIVAATGTGKTVVAAFDYRRICSQEGGRPRLLFVSHRQEILTQAMRTYREVLRDHSFGDLVVGGSEPERLDHVFATIDSITSRGLLANWGPDYWHTVVIDECHRLAADRFDSFARSVKPRHMLGLTATPERADGQPILHYFDSRPDGSPAVELRLWHALDLQLLAPFEYYGCDDDTDFSDVPWSQPGELSAIDQVVTGNDVRARLVIHEWTRLTGSPKSTRTLAFCVSVAHAEFMTKRFNEVGLPALCVTGKTDLEVRRRAPELLREGKLCVLVTCDLYNEGVDLPSVDTLLLLRPTQSPVLFQQQIGRGLRLAEGKESCLVLDFVGRYRTEFRFDRLWGAITGLTRQELKKAVETGFSSLPSGCYIHLQPRTRAQVLDSLRAAINQTWKRLQMELRAYAALKGRTNVGMTAFIRDQAIELGDLYRSTVPSGWTALKRAAGLNTSEASREDDYFGRRFSDLLHLDDPCQLEFITQLAELSDRQKDSPLTPDQELRLLMFAYQIDGQSNQVGSAKQFLSRLRLCPELLSELNELGSMLLARNSITHRPVPGLEGLPLCLHANAGIREILTAVGYYTETRRTPFKAGVLGLSDSKTELLFVTLDKTGWFNGSTAYHDYAISTELFHWQTQNSAGPHTTGGKRYLESKTNGWQFQLFVRARKGDAYRACGPVELVSSEGSQPMSITWRLVHPLPVRLFQTFSVLRGA